MEDFTQEQIDTILEIFDSIIEKRLSREKSIEIYGIEDIELVESMESIDLLFETIDGDIEYYESIGEDCTEKRKIISALKNYSDYFYECNYPQKTLWDFLGYNKG